MKLSLTFSLSLSLLWSISSIDIATSAVACEPFGFDKNDNVAFESTCRLTCDPQGYDITHFVKVNETHDNFIVRETTCDCDAPNNFKCADVENVWDLDDEENYDPNADCMDKYNITDDPTCASFCSKTFGPAFYRYKSSNACSCSDIAVCSGGNNYSNNNNSSRNAFYISTVVTTIIVMIGLSS